MSYGADLIAVERARQVSKEGWTPEHDAEHDGGELLEAARCYLTEGLNGAVHTVDWGHAPEGWPWSPSDWKPTDVNRMLVKAGALIAAEIDRRILAGEDGFAASRLRELSDENKRLRARLAAVERPLTEQTSSNADGC